MGLAHHILCADWGKEPGKRRVWEIRANTNILRPATERCDTSLNCIVQYGKKLDGPVLLGIDAAIGAPAHVVERFRQGENKPQANFFEWIQWLFIHGQPDMPVSLPEDWSYARPFISIPPGKGSKKAFPDNGIKLNRDSEAGLGANSSMIVSGIPGTVGSGSRELWRELTSLENNQKREGFSIWPYDGSLNQLLVNQSVVLAEIYPKACYGIALSDSLPTKVLGISKTKSASRAIAIKKLEGKAFHGLEIGCIENCYSSEDDFDAMISAVALYRLFNNKEDFMPNHSLHPAEGAILGKSALLVQPS